MKLVSLMLIFVAFSANASIHDIVKEKSALFGVDEKLVHSVIRQESGYNINARSHAGACGLMQLMPGTAKRFGVRNIFDPEQNIEGGVRYLQFLLGMFEGNVRLAVAAYNAGEGAVQRYGGIPPYAETQDYVRKVLGFYGSVEPIKVTPKEESKVFVAVKPKHAITDEEALAALAAEGNKAVLNLIKKGEKS